MAQTTRSHYFAKSMKATTKTIKPAGNLNIITFLCFVLPFTHSQAIVAIQNAFSDAFSNEQNSQLKYIQEVQNKYWAN